MKYKSDLYKSVDEKGNIIPGVYCADCSEVYRSDGTVRLLHNEISVTFCIKDGDMHVLDGWHIGTEDYSLDEGDDYTLEYYHPGLKQQIMNELAIM